MKRLSKMIWLAARVCDLSCKHLLAADSPALQPWTAGVGSALLLVTRWIDDEAPVLEECLETTIIGASLDLARTAELALQSAVAGGVPALERNSSHQLLHALAAHLWTSAGAFVRFAEAATAGRRPPLHEPLSAPISPYRLVAALLEAAVDTVLKPAERKLPKLPQADLLSGVCNAADALLGLAQKEDEYHQLLVRRQPQLRAADRRSLPALQRAAELITRVLQSLGSGAAAALGKKRTAHSLLGLLICCGIAQRPLPTAAVSAIRAACRALAAVFRGSSQARREFGTPGTDGVFNWPRMAGQIREVVHSEPPPRRQLLERSLQEVDAAAAPPQQQRPPAPEQSGGSGPGSAAPQRTHASAEEAMRVLLEQEEAGAPAGAAPCKAARKRAKKKATAAAASAARKAAAPATAAAASPVSENALPAAGTSITVEADNRTEPAATPSVSGAPASDKFGSMAANGGEADAAAAAPPTAAGGATAASENGLRRSTLSNSPGPTSSGLASAEEDLQRLGLEGGIGCGGGGGGQHSGGSSPSTLPSSSSVAADSGDWWRCPLTRERMADPVVCLGDGLTYERAAIAEWLELHSVSPITGQLLTTRDMVPNHALRNLLQVTHC